MKKLLLAACAASFTLATAQAQTTEFYVVQDSSTKKCTIVDKKPTVTTTRSSATASTRPAPKPKRR